MMSLPASTPFKASHGTPLATLDLPTLETHAWFIDFVQHKAGEVPAGLSRKESIRHQIAAIEQALQQSILEGAAEDNHTSYPLRNLFAPGVYVRELTIPRHSFVIGKIHRHAHANFILKGKVSVLTEDGGWEVLTAPCTMLSPAGVKRMLFTHEDTVWTVVHPTDLTNVEEIEESVIAKCYADIGWVDPVMGPLLEAAPENIQKELT